MPAVIVAAPPLESVATNCRLTLKVVSLTPSLSVVNNVLITSYGSLNIALSFSAECIFVLCLLNATFDAVDVPNIVAHSNCVLEAILCTILVIVRLASSSNVIWSPIFSSS